MAATCESPLIQFTPLSCHSLPWDAVMVGKYTYRRFEGTLLRLSSG